jgi:adenine-specific DNA-methyltransferase
MARKKKSTPVAVDAIKHKDRRANIPTEELRDFVAEDEHAPRTMLYPRDPSLDPQLVWRGKDEQDAADLAVPVVPIYIQEKIHPQALVDDLLAGARQRRAAAAGPQEQQLDLFADFNGIEDFDRKVEFYQHESHWTNRMILGDSLLVMASLAEKEGLKGQVQCIYLDPPYGIKFGSNWQVSTRKRDVKDGKIEDATREPEQIRAFRDTWKLGIHSYLAYLRDRLVVARELLTETGSIFVQIGDENVHVVRCVMDEVFGSENFIATIAFQKTSYATSDTIPTITDFLLWAAKKREQMKMRKLFFSRVAEPSTDDDKGGEGEVSPTSGAFQSRDLASAGPGSTTFDYEFEGKRYHPGANRHWKTTREGLDRLVAAERLFAARNSLRYKRSLTDFPWTEYTNVWTDTVVGSFHEDKLYVVQTSPKVTARCLLMATDPGDLVLDPTCGSGTTACVAEQWGRRWITCDTSRVALALARNRIMAARYPYYLLSDSPEGIDKEAELTGQRPPPYPTEGDIRKGFVYKRVPHVTLKSIANNPDIREGMTRAEIDAAIARHAESEMLYDQPYADNRRIRVSGPFTVESLSPHRVLPAADDNCDGSVSEQEARKQQDFAHMILENLRKAGVQNTRRGERLKFETLEPLAGRWLHAAGTYTEHPDKPATDADAAQEDAGVVRRVAVSIGPEHGTVGPAQVKEAAKEAVQGVGYDVLIVCGFAFDPHVAEEAKRYGKLTVLPAKMNPDLAMADALLKNTGAGNLFMVFGEPDVLVDSDEWIVDNAGRRIVRRGRLARLPGLGGVAEINRAGEAGLSALRQLAQAGDVRAGIADAAGGGVDRDEHRRGRGAQRDAGVRPLPGDSAGIGGGAGDAAAAHRRAGAAAGGGGSPAAGGTDDHPQDALSADEIAALQSLTTAALPLSTSHLAQVTIRGVDVYDPTTGAIRSASTDDIACWFVDTNYNGESFFVRHAYFTGANEPYEKLKRALRAEVDEAAWSSLYSTTSRPFPRPETGRIAVKVINHYGDEVLKVFEVQE